MVVSESGLGLWISRAGPQLFAGDLPGVLAPRSKYRAARRARGFASHCRRTPAAPRRAARPRKRSSKLLHDWEHSAADILESHISYPVVSYFRSQHNNESWLAALAAILDRCSFLISYVDTRFAPGSAHVRHVPPHRCRSGAAFQRGATPTTANRLPSCGTARACTKCPDRSGLSAARHAGGACRNSSSFRAMYEPYLQALSRISLYGTSSVDSGEGNHRQLENQRVGPHLRLSPARIRQEPRRSRPTEALPPARYGGQPNWTCFPARSAT